MNDFIVTAHHRRPCWAHDTPRPGFCDHCNRWVKAELELEERGATDDARNGIS